jgi:FlaA1/EpsC-like NDP-sugar epimerase
MGASKRLGEMIVRGYAATTGCNMTSVRFGNVLGSRGSVVLTMRNQIRQGKPVTVTDPNMVRFFMTIPEAVQLILQAGAQGGNGQVFVLDMGQPVRILDLAHDLIRLSGLVPNQDIPICITGRRPGEKIEEAILSRQEEKVATKEGAFYMAPSLEVELATLKSHIERLNHAAEDGDDALLLNLLHEAVPDFSHESATAHKNGHANSSKSGKETLSLTPNGSGSLTKKGLASPVAQPKGETVVTPRADAA